MSIATIEHDTVSTAGSPHEGVEVAAWLDHSASLSRLFTRGQYVPRHRAEGPAR